MNTNDRRGFLRDTAVGGAALLGGNLVSGREKGSAGRPNILFAISDDQSWLHTGASGDPVVRTPAFDRVARSGVRFTHAFSCAPSCQPSRSAILTGQDIWRLEKAANLWSTLDKKFPVYPDLLEQSGYQVGYSGKGCNPGNVKAGGRTRNPAGPPFRSFGEFHAGLAKDRPFCFWFGGFKPHRPYVEGIGRKAGMRPENVVVPPWIPDVPEVRSDMLDYYQEIQAWDSQLAEVTGVLEQAGQLENTLIIVTSDNGMPFPRAKATLYDAGIRMPLAISWPARVPAGRVVDDMVSFTDLAPTLLEAAGLKPLAEMTGRSLLPALLSGKSGRVEESRNHIFSAMERHALCRPNGQGYPMRAMRTYDYLYIRNFEPDREPAGSPEGYGDIAESPTKTFVVTKRETEKYGHFFRLSMGKRPAEELYDLKNDPAQLKNVADTSAYAEARRKMKEQLENRLQATRDPRLTGGNIIWDSIPFYGPGGV